MKTTTAGLVLILACACLAGLGSNTLALKKKLQSDGAKQLCISSVRGEDVTDTQAAFGLLYLGWETDAANSRLKAAIKETGGDERQMPLWLRIYSLFGGSDGRLDDECKDMLAGIFAQYVQEHNKPAIAPRQYTTDEFCRICSVYLALEILQDNGNDLPTLTLKTIETDLGLWNGFLLEYCRAAIRGGLWPAVLSGTKGADLLCCLVNLYDFTRDEPLKKRVSMLLDIIWADWAQDQFNLVRGGARIDTAIPVKENDAIKLCATPFLSQDMNWTDGRKYTTPHHNAIYIMATTSWRMQDVVMDIILDAGGKGEFEYKSHLPAKSGDMLKRYSYCTGEYILGAFFIDPSEAESRTPEVLNAVQGLTFANGAYAMVSCEGGVVQAIGDKNILIFQHPGEKELKVSLSEGIIGSITERGGWLIFRQSSTWAAIKGLSIRKPGAGCGYEWASELEFTLKEPACPLVMVAGSAIKYRALEAFVKYITEHDWRIKDGVLTYDYTDSDDVAASFVMYLDGSAKPLANDKPLNFSDFMLLESPFLKSAKDSGVITLTKDNRKLMYYIDRDEVLVSK